MTDGRFFTKRQRSAIFSKSRGVCQDCREPLDRGWHADHVIPHSLGGRTVISNGQALCPSCSLKKGSSVDSIERLHELLYQAIRAPGMNPENVYLLLRTVLDQEYPESEPLEEQSRRFHQFLARERANGGLELQPAQLTAMLGEFRHPREDDHEETRQWMRHLRERIKRLLPGEAGDRSGPAPGVVGNTHNPPRDNTAARIIRRLNRDRPDLAQAVAEGRTTANAAAIEMGWRKRRVAIPVDDPERAAATLIHAMKPDDAYRLGALLRGET